MRIARELSFSAGLLALAAAATPALAQDVEPTVRDVQVNGRSVRRGPLGGNVVVLGKNFHVCPRPEGEGEGEQKAPACRHEEVKVTIGSTKCMLLAAGPGMVQFLIPQFGVTPGRKTIRIEIGRKSCTVDFEAVDPEAWQNEADQQAQENMEGGGGRAPDLEERLRDQFRITRFDLKRDGGANRFEVEGVAGKLPDGFTLDMVLQFDGREIAGRKVQTQQGGGFSVTFGPFTKQLLFGNYGVTLLFELGKQSRVRARRFVRTLSNEEKEIYDRIERPAFRTVGTPQEVETQRRELQEHYHALTRECQELLGEFESAFASAARVFFKKSGQAGYDETAYGAYLQRMDFAETADDVTRIKRDTRFATGSGHFEAKAYEEWASETFVPRLTELYTKHDDFKTRYIAPLNERAELLSDYCVSIVFGLFQDWSRQLYTRSNLQVPEVVSNAPINPITAPTMSKRFFNAQRRMLLRQVGLEDVVAAEDAAAEKE